MLPRCDCAELTRRSSKGVRALAAMAAARDNVEARARHELQGQFEKRRQLCVNRELEQELTVAMCQSFGSATQSFADSE